MSSSFILFHRIDEVESDEFVASTVGLAKGSIKKKVHLIYNVIFISKQTSNRIIQLKKF